MRYIDSAGGQLAERTGKVRVFVETREFVIAHGRAPRGRGGWAFAFDRADAEGVNADYLARAFWVNGVTYGQAKRAAIAEAVKRGVSTVWVLS